MRAPLLLSLTLPCCAAFGHHAHSSLILEVTSGGTFRSLIRREGSSADETSNSTAPRGGGFGASEAKGDAAWSTAGKERCDETEEMCCKPTKADPRGLYLMCLQRNCLKMKKPDAICKAKGVCTKDCSLGCCCFWLGTASRLKAFATSAKRSLVQLAVMLQAFQQGYVQQQQPDEPVARPDPTEVAAYAVDVVVDTLKWAAALPCAGLLLVVLHIRALGMYKKEQASSKPSWEQLNPAERMLMQQQEEEKAREELDKFLEAGEQDRLGGVEQIVMTEVSGLSDIMWLLTQALSIGLHYFLMTEYAQTGICVLGKTGRVLVINRRPLLSGPAAGGMFRGAGVSHILFVMLVNMYLRSLERALILARRFAEAEAVKVPLLAKVVKGKVTWFTLAFAVCLWLLYYALLKMSIRPWGSDLDRNYYESKEASVSQYFRTGSRGVIPCLSKRRRRGGLRLFFGPYPERSIFNHLGRGSSMLHNVEPCLVLPTETDNGYPQSGSGTPKTADEKATSAQLMLGALNSFLGTLGLVIFGIHIYNFLTNVQNCPVGGDVRSCVDAEDCTRVARSPWFAHHLVMNNLRSQADVVADQLLPDVGLETVSTWLKAKSADEAGAMVLNISREACWKRYVELYLDPNATLFSATSDTIGKFNAANYMNSVTARGYRVSFDEETLHCQDCVRSYFLFYFTNFDNVVEIIEVLMLMITSYVSALVYKLATRKLSNCPMVDLAFASDPGSSKVLDVDRLERGCLAMIGHTFFYRYSNLGVPPHIAELEEAMRRSSVDTTTLPDPWIMDNTADSWNNYDLSSPTNRRLMVVNRSLLGILEGEEVVSAWSETPRLSSWQIFLIVGGVFMFLVVPLYFAAVGRSALCFAEAICMEAVHAAAVKLYIFDRRPQAGFVLTSRRLLQVSRLPAYTDVFGKTEPVVKLDVLIHNSSLAYASMTMEAYTPLWRRALGKVMSIPLYRRGQVIVQGAEGIFKLWRYMGDARDAFHTFSKVTDLTRLDPLRPALGESFLQEERRHGATDEELPDPLCACLCCPYSPPPVGLDGPLLERYVTRKPRELDVYGRKLAVRPASCGELCCGRGCRLGCCCRLEELSTDFIVTTHRILVEQRSVQRYCRFVAFLRRTPNIRATFLAHHRAAAYLCEKEAAAYGLTKVKRDLSIKLLQKDAHEYTSGLMLMQRPYAILSKQQNASFKDAVWLAHISSLYDIMTADEDYAEEEELSVRSGSDEWSSATPPAQEEMAPEVFEESGKRGMASKGKGKGKARGKGKGGRKGDPDTPVAAAAEVAEEVAVRGSVPSPAASESSGSFRG